MHSTNQELSFDILHAHITEIVAFLLNIALKFTKLPHSPLIPAAILDFKVNNIFFFTKYMSKMVLK